MTTKSEMLKTIRRNCILCMGNQPSLVEGCTSPDCELFPYRMGKDPWKKRKGDSARFKKVDFNPYRGKEKAQISTQEPMKAKEVES